jgi:tripeptidyl-peptidase-2
MVLCRRLVGAGDAFPSKWSLKVEKGEYTAKVHVRHEKKELVDRSDIILG